jgi:hypothetical protein
MNLRHATIGQGADLVPIDGNTSIAVPTFNRMLVQPLVVLEKGAQRLPYLPVLIAFRPRRERPGIEQNIPPQHQELRPGVEQWIDRTASGLCSN